VPPIWNNGQKKSSIYSIIISGALLKEIIQYTSAFTNEVTFQSKLISLNIWNSSTGRDPLNYSPESTCLNSELTFGYP